MNSSCAKKPAHDGVTEEKDMGINSKIEWTNHTWNPWQGCTKVSEGCRYCYMYREQTRYKQDPSNVRKSAHQTFFSPLSQRRFRPGDRVFVCSWSDFFHEAADPWRNEAFSIMRLRPDLRFIIVTKRIERAKSVLPANWGDGWPNVALLVSAENQQRWDERIPHLLSTPAAIRGVSAEPLIGRIDGAPWLLWKGHIDWLIVGGESGLAREEVRKMDIGWVRDLRDQCAAGDVPFFFKQWGEYGEDGERRGTPYTGRRIDGVEHSQLPKEWS